LGSDSESAEEEPVPAGEAPKEISNCFPEPVEERKIEEENVMTKIPAIPGIQKQTHVY
jgi:hypothetical protein